MYLPKAYDLFILNEPHRFGICYKPAIESLLEDIYVVNKTYTLLIR